MSLGAGAPGTGEKVVQLGNDAALFG